MLAFKGVWWMKMHWCDELTIPLHLEHLYMAHLQSHFIRSASIDVSFCDVNFQPQVACDITGVLQWGQFHCSQWGCSQWGWSSWQLEEDCATKVQTYPNQPTSAGIRIIPMPSPDLSSAVLAYQGFEATRKEIRIPHSCHWEGSVLSCQNGDLGAISGVEYTSRAQAGWRKFPGETCNEKGRL